MPSRYACVNGGPTPGASASQPRINHIACSCGTHNILPTSERRERRKRKEDSIYAYSPHTLLRRLGTLPAPCQHGSGVLKGCLACARGQGEGYKDGGAGTTDSIGLQLPAPPTSSSSSLPHSTSCISILGLAPHERHAPACPRPIGEFVSSSTLCLRVLDSGSPPLPRRSTTSIRHLYGFYTLPMCYNANDADITLNRTPRARPSDSQGKAPSSLLIGC